MSGSKPMCAKPSTLKSYVFCPETWWSNVPNPGSERIDQRFFAVSCAALSRSGSAARAVAEPWADVAGNPVEIAPHGDGRGPPSIAAHHRDRLAPIRWWNNGNYCLGRRVIAGRIGTVIVRGITTALSRLRRRTHSCPAASTNRSSVLYIIFQHCGDHSARVLDLLQLRASSHALMAAIAPRSRVVLGVQIEELNVSGRDTRIDGVCWLARSIVSLKALIDM